MLPCTSTGFERCGEKSGINAVAVTPDGQRIISASDDATVKVWDFQNRIQLLDLEVHRAQVTDIAVFGGGQFAISVSRDCSLKLWDLRSGTVLTSFIGDSELLSCAVAPDGVTIVAGEISGRLHFLRLENLRQKL
ncbi:WD40 repeat domain-containing protein [Nostoc sp.]|uniref:WD40 repeat domain-containing protein n=1 Tax=Nostoc sp. TaxID=1180 RepID=UPI002FEFA07B